MNKLILVLALAIISLLAYRLFIKPKPKREVPVGQANLYFFYTDWCGWSQKAMPEWEKVKTQLSGQKVGSYQIKTIEVNADKDRKTTETYEVTGYPTIKLETSKDIYEFHGKRTADEITDFVKNSLV
jgi:thiol-disulfide isomerase/thioredoxin